tara:strand:- start:1528 stop:1845 length:318 start_codon:yes stop_codon:yes gene_type:complete
MSNLTKVTIGKFDTTPDYDYRGVWESDAEVTMGGQFMGTITRTTMKTNGWKRIESYAVNFHDCGLDLGASQNDYVSVIEVADFDDARQALGAAKKAARVMLKKAA